MILWHPRQGAAQRCGSTPSLLELSNPLRACDLGVTSFPHDVWVYEMCFSWMWLWVWCVQINVCLCLEAKGGWPVSCYVTLPLIHMRQGFPLSVIPLPLRSECWSDRRAQLSLALTPCWDLNSGSHAWATGTLTHQATCLPLIDGTKKFILTSDNISGA